MAAELKKQGFCEYADLPVRLQDVLECFQKLFVTRQTYNDLIMNPDYHKLSSLALHSNNLINTNASKCLLIILNNNIYGIDVKLNIFKQLLSSAEDITGITQAILNILLEECRITDKCRKCLYNMSNRPHPLFMALECHPQSAGTLINLLLDMVERENHMIETLHPVFLYFLYFFGIPNVEMKKAELLKYVCNKRGFHFTSDLLFWAKVNDVSVLEDLIFGPFHNVMCRDNIYCWLLACTHLACKQSQQAFISIKTLSKLERSIHFTPVYVQSLVGLALGLELFRGPVSDIEALTLLVRKLGLSGDIWREVLWVIIVGLVRCSEYALLDKQLLYDVCDQIFCRSCDWSAIRCTPISCSLVKKFCLRFPTLCSSVQILRLFCSIRTERKALAWLNSLLNNEGDSFTLKVVVSSLCLCGNYNIRKAAYKLFFKWGGEFIIGSYFLSKETSKDLCFFLSESLCLSSKNEVQTRCFITFLDKIVLTENVNTLLKLVIVYDLWNSNYSNESYDLLIFMLNKKLRGSCENELFLYKGMLLFNLVSRWNMSEDLVWPLIGYIFKNYTNYQLGDIACAFALGVVEIMWDKNIFRIEDVLGIIMDLSERQINVVIKKSVCKILSKVPRHVCDNEILMNKCAFILWCYAIGEEQCSLAYDALKKFKIGHFCNFFLPKSCSEHLVGDSCDEILGECWLHLLMSGWAAETAELFSYLLKKELKMNNVLTDRFLNVYTTLFHHLRKSKLTNEMEVNCTVLCLKILRENVVKGTNLNYFEFFETLILCHEIRIRKNALVILIRLAYHYQSAKLLLHKLVRIYKIVSDNILTLYENFSELELVCEVPVLQNIVRHLFNKVFKSDRTLFFECLRKINTLVRKSVLGGYILFKMKLLLKKMNPSHKDLYKLLNCLSTFEMALGLKTVEKNPSTYDDFERLIYLYSEFGKKEQTIKCLRFVLQSSTALPGLQSLGVNKICEILLNVKTKTGLDFWPYYIISKPDLGNRMENNYNFLVFILSVDILSGAHLHGTASDAITRLPQNCVRLYSQHKFVKKVVTVLSFWKCNENLDSKFQQVCYLTLMTLRDNIQENRITPEFWRSVICDNRHL